MTYSRRPSVSVQLACGAPEYRTVETKLTECRDYDFRDDIDDYAIMIRHCRRSFYYRWK